MQLAYNCFFCVFMLGPHVANSIFQPGFARQRTYSCRYRWEDGDKVDEQQGYKIFFSFSSCCSSLMKRRERTSCLFYFFVGILFIDHCFVLNFRFFKNEGENQNYCGLDWHSSSQVSAKASTSSNAASWSDMACTVCISSSHSNHNLFVPPSFRLGFIMVSYLSRFLLYQDGS